MLCWRTPHSRGFLAKRKLVENAVINIQRVQSRLSGFANILFSCGVRVPVAASGIEDFLNGPLFKVVQSSLVSVKSLQAARPRPAPVHKMEIPGQRSLSGGVRVSADISFFSAADRAETALFLAGRADISGDFRLMAGHLLNEAGIVFSGQGV